MTEGGESSDYLRTDQRADAASSLKHLILSLQQIPAALHEWKWAIVAAHSALQGALVCVLSGTAEIDALTDKSRKDTLRWLDERRANTSLPSPEQRVAELPVLLKRAHDLQWMKELDGLPLKLAADTRNDLEKLHEFRNQFTHFPPSDWRIGISGLPRMVNASMRTAQLLLLSHLASARRLTPEQSNCFADLFEQVSSELKRLGADGLPDQIPAAERLAKPES